MIFLVILFLKGDNMQEKYNEVPNIITCKDLDYLKDMFNWNYEALKKSVNAYNNVTDEELGKVIYKASELFDNNLNIILKTLEVGGGDSE